MADDTGQSQEGADTSVSVKEAGAEANKELGTEFGGPDILPDEGAETDAPSEDGSDEESSSPDVKQEESESKPDEDDGESETPEAKDEDGKQSAEDSEAQEGEGEDGDEGPVPYERFKEVNDEKNELKSEKEQLSSQIESIQQEKEQLQQEVDYYLNTEEGNEALKNHLEEQGVIENGETQENSSLKEQLEEVKQALPNQAGEGLEQVLSQVQDQIDQLQQGQSQQNGQEPIDPQTQQEVEQDIRQTVDTMQKSDTYPDADLVFDPDATQGPKSLAEVVMQENPEKYADSNGLPDTDKFDELYRETAEKFDLRTGEAVNSEPDGSNGQVTGDDISLEDLPEEKQDKLKQEARKELADDGSSVEPMEPSAGGSDSGESSVESLQEAINQAAKETGFAGG